MLATLDVSQANGWLKVEFEERRPDRFVTLEVRGRRVVRGKSPDLCRKVGGLLGILEIHLGTKSVCPVIAALAKTDTSRSRM